MKSYLKTIVVALVAVALLRALVSLLQGGYEVGEMMDAYRGVAVYYNGTPSSQSHGRHYNVDDYYYGQKWQCVEFVKRFYADALGHRMPDGWGHAKDFFDRRLRQGAFNERRGLLQFNNGGNVPPEPNDIVVFQDTGLGHVAVVTRVDESEVELIQQNVPEASREMYRLINDNTVYLLEGSRKAAGWMRKRGD